MVSEDEKEEEWELNRNAIEGVCVYVCVCIYGQEFRAACELGNMKEVEEQKKLMYPLSDLVGRMCQCAVLLPAAFPNLTCSAESGMSLRNLKGSESP